MKEALINEGDFYQGWTLVYREDNKFKLGYISELLMEKDPQILGPLIKTLTRQMQQAMQRGGGHVWDNANTD